MSAGKIKHPLHVLRSRFTLLLVIAILSFRKCCFIVVAHRLFLFARLHMTFIAQCGISCLSKKATNRDIRTAIP